jgi:hypothetical protein
MFKDYLISSYLYSLWLVAERTQDRIENHDSGVYLFFEALNQKLFEFWISTGRA